jgi:3-methyl-2-oxobutanoate hydroxymethyltransferase
MTSGVLAATKKDRAYLQRKKDRGEPIAMLTCYDYPTAVQQEQAGLDIIFVGDSVGTNILGYTAETEVTMEDMLHHLRAVRRGVTDAFLLVDMPYRSFDTPEIALRNARRLIDAGADAVKLEGGVDQTGIVRALTSAGIDVCGHIGFTPQTLGSKGRVQGKSFDAARGLIESADALQEAGAFLLVLELVTEDLSRLISQRLHIPTIGIGSGRYCDGQVLVMTDVLGISPFSRKIVKRYADVGEQMRQAFSAYRDDVVHRRFPEEGNAFPTQAAELAQIERWLRDQA